MRRILILLAMTLLLVSTWIALTKGRVEPGESESNITHEKNIVYIHVPSAICSSICFAVLLVSGIGYLWTKSLVWDYVGAASAEVALVLATVLNVTGSIFARSFWQTWWTPSPRLVSSAILWFLCVAYMILRASIPSAQRRARLCAVFGIIAFIDVPMLYISARMIGDMHISNVSFESGWQSAAFGMAILGTLVLAASLIWLKVDILKVRGQLESEIMN